MVSKVRKIQLNGISSFTRRCSGTTDENPAISNTVNVTVTKTPGPNYKDWKRRLANHEQCTTTFDGTTVKVESREARFSWSRSVRPGAPACPLGDQTVRGQGSGFAALPYNPTVSGSSSMTKADNQAKVNFVRKVRQTQTSFQGGVFLGELAEAIHLLKHPAQTLRRGLDSYLNSLKKGRSRILRSRGKTRKTALKTLLSDTWLEYAFGWRPLISDINDAAETVANHFNRSHLPTVTFVFGHGRDEVGGYHESATFSSWGSVPITYGYSYRDTEYSDVKYYGQVAVEAPYQLSWRMAGFSLDNFLPTVWELIPYSFLADYFANIGEIIECASTPLANLRWVGKGTRTGCIRRSFFLNSPRILAGSVNYLSPPALTHSPGMVTVDRATVHREPYAGSLVPSLYLRVPGVGSTKWINMAALALGHNRLRPFF